ncbi:MAG TPA: HEPN domain-containing protein [Deltaproteobacteria bacterium]|nr:HEPN domain-containing protein [Deltaproteobacteria bacterium]
MTDDAERQYNLLSHANELWIAPEIERRKAIGEPLLDPLHAFQVILNVDAPTEVRFNGEIQGILEGRVTRAVTAGEQIMAGDLSEVTGFDLGDEDPNAGHLTALLLGEKWWLSFDFRYNAARINDYFKIARQFLDVAKFAIESGRRNAGISNLYEATELLAKCFLLVRPEKELLKPRSHKLIATRLNREAKFGNVDSEHSKLLNELARLRPKARYELDHDTINRADAEGLLARVEAFYLEVEERRPKRSASDLAAV